ncbi:unnamed protein product, partial [Amoebophrya sp. A120]|eukprot:GSA120T00014774001.1
MALYNDLVEPEPDAETQEAIAIVQNAHHSTGSGDTSNRSTTTTSTRPPPAELKREISDTIENCKQLSTQVTTANQNTGAFGDGRPGNIYNFMYRGMFEKTVGELQTITSGTARRKQVTQGMVEEAYNYNQGNKNLNFIAGGAQHQEGNEPPADHVETSASPPSSAAPTSGGANILAATSSAVDEEEEGAPSFMGAEEPDGHLADEDRFDDLSQILTTSSIPSAPPATTSTAKASNHDPNYAVGGTSSSKKQIIDQTRLALQEDQKHCSMQKSLEFTKTYFPIPIDLIHTGCRVHKVQNVGICIANNTVLDFRSRQMDTRVWGEQGWDEKRFPNQKNDTNLAIDEDPKKGILIAEQALESTGMSAAGVQVDSSGGKAVLKMSPGGSEVDHAGEEQGAAEEQQPLHRSSEVEGGTSSSSTSEDDVEKEQPDGTKYLEQDRAWGDHAHGLFLRNQIRRQLKVSHLCNEWGRHTLWANTRNVLHKSSENTSPAPMLKLSSGGEEEQKKISDDQADVEGGAVDLEEFEHDDADLALKARFGFVAQPSGSASTSTGESASTAQQAQDRQNRPRTATPLSKLKHRFATELERLESKAKAAEINEGPNGKARSKEELQKSLPGMMKKKRRRDINFHAYDQARQPRVLQKSTWIVSVPMVELNMSHFFLFFTQILSDAPIRIGFEKLQYLFIWVSGGTADGCFPGPEPAVWHRWRAEYLDFLDLLAVNVILLYSFDHVAVFARHCNEQPGERKSLFFENEEEKKTKRKAEWSWREANWAKLLLRDMVRNSPQSLVLSSLGRGGKNLHKGDATTDGSASTSTSRHDIITEPPATPEDESNTFFTSREDHSHIPPDLQSETLDKEAIVAEFVQKLAADPSTAKTLVLHGSAVRDYDHHKNHDGKVVEQQDNHLYSSPLPYERRFSGCFKHAFIGQHEKIQVHSLRHAVRSTLQLSTARLVITSALLRGRATRTTTMKRDGAKTRSDVHLDKALASRASSSSEDSRSRSPSLLYQLWYGSRPGLFFAGPETNYRRRLSYFILQRKIKHLNETENKNNFRGDSGRNFEKEQFERQWADLKEKLKDHAVGFHGHFEDKTMTQQLTTVQASSFFIGSHGAGLAWTTFLRPYWQSSAVIEILPQQPVATVQGLCQRQNNWDRNLLAIYGGLARVADVHHYCQ